MREGHLGKRGPKPSENRRISRGVRLPPETWAQLEGLAIRSGATMALVLESLIEAAIMAPRAPAPSPSCQELISDPRRRK